MSAPVSRERLPAGLSMRLEGVLGVGAETWLNMKESHDLGSVCAQPSDGANHHP